MREITVKASKTYTVSVSKGILKDIALYTPGEKARHAVIVTDDTVAALYGSAVEKSLSESGLSVSVFTFPHSEESKNMNTYTALLEFLAVEQITRSDFIVALGGGVTGDLAGYAAATYLRGIPFIQVPTTFLSAIDSSVGGKTGVNLAAGKNLAGAFYQPYAVLCDPSTFGTLSPKIFRDGIAEAIKYGVILDEKLFSDIEGGMIETDIESVIESCVSIKRNVVEADEFDRGERQLLNFGHTVGHAIEKLSHYEISHGHAVAAGMAIVSRAAVKIGFAEAGVASRIVRLIEKMGLPTRCEFDANTLSRVIAADKKRSGGDITLILPKKVGECRLHRVPLTEIPGILQKGL